MITGIPLFGFLFRGKTKTTPMMINAMMNSAAKRATILCFYVTRIFNCLLSCC